MKYRGSNNKYFDGKNVRKSLIWSKRKNGHTIRYAFDKLRRKDAADNKNNNNINNIIMSQLGYCT